MNHRLGFISEPQRENKHWLLHFPSDIMKFWSCVFFFFDKESAVSSTEGEIHPSYREIWGAIEGFMSFLPKAGYHYSNYVSADLSPSIAVPTEWGPKERGLHKAISLLIRLLCLFALLSKMFFRGQPKAGRLMEGSALEFHFESGGK